MAFKKKNLEQGPWIYKRIYAKIVSDYDRCEGSVGSQQKKKIQNIFKSVGGLMQKWSQTVRWTVHIYRQISTV